MISAGGIEQEGLILLSLLSSVTDTLAGFKLSEGIRGLLVIL